MEYSELKCQDLKIVLCYQISGEAWMVVVPGSPSTWRMLLNEHSFQKGCVEPSKHQPELLHPSPFFVM